MVVVALFIAGDLAVLALAPERQVAGSAGLADRWGLSRVVIGAVVIGFGTSAPELLVSRLAAALGEPEVGVGNIVGSNMANLGLIVAAAGLIGHLAVPAGLLRRELPLTFAATAAFALAVQDGLTRREGTLLLVALVAALWCIARPATATTTDETDELATEVDEFLLDEATQPAWRLAVDALGGLVGTLIGAQLLGRGRSRSRPSWTCRAGSWA